MADIEVIVPNLNRRFSGVTSTMARVLPHQAERIGIAVCGYPIPGVALERLGWGDVLRRTREPLPGGGRRVWHARRNLEMAAGLWLRDVARRRLFLAFTSVAQRHHTAWTRFLYGRMDALVSTSARSASFLRRKPEAIVPHGVDTRVFVPADDRAAAWREAGLPGARGVGILGRVRPGKGVGDFVAALVEVLPRHPDVTGVVIGETTPAYRRFEQECRDRLAAAGLSDRVRWLGPLPFGEIPGWFRRLSLVVAVPHSEGFGLTGLEAMASGTAVIGSRAGSFEEVIVEGETGRIVPVSDSVALARALDEVLRDPRTLEAMGRAARDHVVARHTIEREARTLVDLYRGWIGRP